MNTPKIRGITGLLDEILSPAGQTAAGIGQAHQLTNNPPIGQSAVASARQLPITVRRGRPPGKANAALPKEKVTVWITASLIADYREWTWEARCQLSNLVERALADYRRSCSTDRAGQGVDREGPGQPAV
jgi:hypothetical protein